MPENLLKAPKALSDIPTSPPDGSKHRYGDKERDLQGHAAREIRVHVRVPLVY